MAEVNNGPVPTTLALLSEIPGLPPGTKVRFLGCVSCYTTKSAILTLKHNHPPRPAGQTEKPIKVQVDVQLLLTTMKAKETQVGEWVNVIGYITTNPNTNPKDGNPSKDDSDLQVQALILWSAGSFDLHGYEQSLDQQKRDRESSAKKLTDGL